MLLTDDRHGVAGVSRMLGAGLRLWRAVSLELHVPYYLVRFSVVEGASQITQTTILWRDEDVLEFCEEVQMAQDQKILQIARLCPPIEGKEDEWDLTALAAVWKGTDQKTGQSAVIFFRKNGERIALKGGGSYAAEIDLVQQVYP